MGTYHPFLVILLVLGCNGQLGPNGCFKVGHLMSLFGSARWSVVTVNPFALLGFPLLKPVA